MPIEKSKVAASISRILKHKYFLLFFLWFVLTAINIDKAFHIDDTFHLEVSECIKHTPLKPMSGLINWYSTPEPIYEYNQPALFFYSIALVSKIFGNHEIPLHLFLSVFTFLALYFFYRIAELLSLKQKNTLLALFAFCPAFIINQNLMTDIPILALLMGFVYFLLKAGINRKLTNYSISASLLGFGLLIKYSLLPLLVVLALVILIRREYKNLIVLLIPVGLLCLWSIWNYIEYGAIHILNRQRGEIQFNQFLAFMGCLGSISVISISFVFGLFSSKITKWLLYLIVFAFAISIVFFAFNFISEKSYSRYLNNSFIINGFVIFVALFVAVASSLKKTGLRNSITSGNFVVFLSFLTLSLFIILAAPFIATRHVLLVIPFILILAYELIDKATIEVNRLTITITVILGLLLGFSDWKYADYYRQMASEIHLPEGKNIWTAGHWGWQWYSVKNGMKP
ncbi:MAG TPA: glycosyltransferase family 39 protein, partial [Bacteroidales bacterium]